MAGAAVNAVHKEVLALLLEHHPALLAEQEVVRHLAPEPATFGERDSVAVAIRELTQAGLAHRLDRFVFATAAAAGFRELEDA